MAAVKNAHQSYKDNSSYNGDWNADGQKHGKGTLTYSDMTLYKGEFVGGLQEGRGVMTIPDKTGTSRYEGQFKQGVFDGYGVFTQGDGLRYEGQFTGGYLTGFGLITFKDGSHGLPKYEGRFDNGKLVQPQTCPEHVRKAKDAASEAAAVSASL